MNDFTEETMATIAFIMAVMIIIYFGILQPVNIH